MVVIVIDHSHCDLCGACIEVCAMQGLAEDQGRLKMLDPSLCMVCKACEAACRAAAIHVYRDGDPVPIFEHALVSCYRA